MKFSIQREDLITPLQQVIGAVEKRQTMPTLSNVLVRIQDNTLSLTATDLEIELVSKIQLMADQAGETTLPAKKLLDIFKALPAESTVNLLVDGDKALIQSGRSRFTLSTLPASDFPSLESVASVYEFSLPQAVLRELIEKTAFAMAQQDVRYYLNGLMLEVARGTIRAVATDGHRLAYCEKVIDSDLADNKQVIVPRKGINELLRLLADSDEPVKVVLGSNHIQCHLANQRFTSKLIDGRFPDYRRVIPQEEGHVVTADREALKQALVRASILSNEKYRGIRVILGDNLLKLQAQNPDQEQADIELEVSHAGSALEVGFNVNYMMDALNTTSQNVVNLFIKDASSSCLLKFPDEAHCRYVIMPMRL
jgi:DNA polymerase-3 subunit beta